MILWTSRNTPLLDSAFTDDGVPDMTGLFMVVGLGVVYSCDALLKESKGGMKTSRLCLVRDSPLTLPSLEREAGRLKGALFLASSDVGVKAGEPWV